MGGSPSKKLWGSMSLVLALSLAIVGCSNNGNGGGNAANNEPRRIPRPRMRISPRTPRMTGATNKPRTT